MYKLGKNINVFLSSACITFSPSHDNAFPVLRLNSTVVYITNCQLNLAVTSRYLLSQWVSVHTKGQKFPEFITVFLLQNRKNSYNIFINIGYKIKIKGNASEPTSNFFYRKQNMVAMLS